MTNVEFITTYIFQHPGARYREIMDAFHTWRGRETGTHLSHSYRSWGCQYFTNAVCPRYHRRDPGYKDKYWTYVEHNNAFSGYRVTLQGLSKVRQKVVAFSVHRKVQ